MYKFNVEKTTADLINWIKDWFEENGKDSHAVIGISGGKDSTVVAALCVKALGKDRVIGVMMPNGVQKDISDSIHVCEFLDIENYTINIADAVNDEIRNIEKSGLKPSKQMLTNLPARIRMTTLYAVAQSEGIKGRVSNNCNRSENYVSYETKFGDGAGDFAPIANLTVREILAIGDYLGLPKELIHKTPIDGLNTNEDGSYVTDEQSMGFTYNELDDYLLEGIKPDKEKLNKIEKMHVSGVDKNRMLAFNYKLLLFFQKHMYILKYISVFLCYILIIIFLLKKKRN